jgi:hypothetical protein
VVSAWNAEGADPTWATGWTLENTADTDLALTNAYQTFTIENVSIDTANAVNLAVFIWIDDTDVAAGDVVYIADVQLELGAFATPYQHRSFAEELALCQRYFNCSFPLGTTPARSAGQAGALQDRIYIDGAAGDSSGGVDVRFPVPMFTTPSIVFYSTDLNNTAWYDTTGTAQSGASDSLDEGNTGFYAEHGDSGNDDLADIVAVHYTAEGEM